MGKGVKGNNHNPNGRPVGTPQPATKYGWKLVGDVRSLAKEWTIEAINTLAEVMKDKGATPAARVAAAQCLLDRGWGKSAQIVEATISNYERMSDDELVRLVEATVVETGPNSGRIEFEEEPEEMPE